MGYMKKGGTVANPAKKSLTVFQNSFQVWDHDDIVTGTRSVPIYGTVSFSIGWSISSYTHEFLVNNSSPYTLSCSCDGRSFTAPPNRQSSSGSIYGGGKTSGTVSCNGQVLYNGSDSSATISKNIQVGSRTETYVVSSTPVYRTEWNTKWSKRSA